MIAFVEDVHSVRQVCAILNIETAEPVDAAIRTLVIYSSTQGMYFTVTRSPLGTWGQTDSVSYHGDVEAITTRLFLTTEGKAVATSAGGGAGGGGGGGGGGGAGGSAAGGLLGHAMLPYEALAAYKRDYPKATMSDAAILDYIAAILSMSDAKKAVGKSLPKLETIQQACATAGLMSSRNGVGQPTPFYQRGGRRTIHTQALDAIFHWVTGVPAKKKHSHSDGTDGEGRENYNAGGGGEPAGGAKPSSGNVKVRGGTDGRTDGGREDAPSFCLKHAHPHTHTHTHTHSTLHNRVTHTCAFSTGDGRPCLSLSPNKSSVVCSVVRACVPTSCVLFCAKCVLCMDFLTLWRWCGCGCGVLGVRVLGDARACPLRVCAKCVCVHGLINACVRVVSIFPSPARPTG